MAGKSVAKIRLVSPVGADSEEDSIEGALVNLVHQVLMAMNLEAFSVHGHGACSAVINHPNRFIVF